jgi:hypothetical protein
MTPRKFNAATAVKGSSLAAHAPLAMQAQGITLIARASRSYLTADGKIDQLLTNLLAPG